MNDQRGSEALDTWVLVENDAATGDLKFTLSVDDSVTGNIGDLRAIYFHIADESVSYLGGLSAYGTDIVGVQQFEANAVQNLVGGSPNINPLGPFDAGIEIGTHGAGGDDIQSTQFFLHSSAGTLNWETFFGVSQPGGNDDFVMGIRGQTVGAAGTSRDGSSKTGSNGGTEGDEFPSPSSVPEPGSVIIWMSSMMICVFGRRRAARI